MGNTTEIIKTLIGLAIDSSYPFDKETFRNVNWKKVMRISAAQGVFAIAFDGIEHLPIE